MKKNMYIYLIVWIVLVRIGEVRFYENIILNVVWIFKKSATLWEEGGLVIAHLGGIILLKITHSGL